MDPQNDWLDSKHPVWEAGMKGAAQANGEYSTTTGVRSSAEIGAWKRNDKRLRGGEDALDELARFDWERGAAGEDRYQNRKAQATYINFPDLLVTTVVGHLFRQAPIPTKGMSLGGLGEVRRKEDRNGEPTRAELLWFNADGVGGDGSQWLNFWAMQARGAMATGHRWIMVESSARKPQNGVVATESDEQAGRRPYLVPLGPDKVTNWHYEEGRLAFAILRVPMRKPRLVDGKLVGNGSEQGYLLLTRRGWEGFGSEYSRGGWFLFDPDRKPVTATAADGTAPQRQGRWESTNGEIPLVPLFYERDTGTEERPAMSRPAISELGQVAVSYMNLSSAADFDAWEAASSVQVVRGADPSGFNMMIAKLEEGSRLVPLPSPQQNPDKIPDITDASTGAVAAEVFKLRLEQKFTEAKHLALQEATGNPDSSGESKKAGFAENKAPRLARFAAEIEQAMNSVLRFIELRWGISSPSAWCEWPREFDLAPLNEDIAEIFDLQERSGVRSPTLTAKLLTQAVREKRLVTDDEDLELIEAEFTVGAFEQQTADRQERAFSAAVEDGDPAVPVAA